MFWHWTSLIERVSLIERIQFSGFHSTWNCAIITTINVRTSSLLWKETPHPVAVTLHSSSISPSPLPSHCCPTAGQPLITFCLYHFTFCGHYIQMRSYNICYFVNGFFVICFFCLFVCFFSFYSHTCGIWTILGWGWIRAAAVSLYHNHNTTRSEQHLWSTQQLAAMPNP